MDLGDVYQKHRRLLLFAQLISGDSLQERIRNLAWILNLLTSGENCWESDELVILAQESTPFLPAAEIAKAVGELRVLTFAPETETYNLNSYADLYEDGLPASLNVDDCRFSLEELRVVLKGGSAKRITWNRSDLKTILSKIVEFGFHCIRSWRSLVRVGKELEGVTFLWNVTSDGQTSPSGEVPASSATIDILRLAVEPLNLIDTVPTDEEKELVQWAFDRIYRNIRFVDDSKAYYYLPGDDSYPDTAHPINDSQARVIHLLVKLLQQQRYLDKERIQFARKSAIGLGHYLLSQQLIAPGEVYDGFWSFHKYEDRGLDGFQVLTINSELAVKSLESLWEIADEKLKRQIAAGIAQVVTALKRTAIHGSGWIAWQKHFSSLTRQGDRDCEVFATARAMLILAIAKRLGLFKDLEYIRHALKFIEQNWSVGFENVDQDVEFIPYRSPELSKWTDGTFRITNPISAIMPYCLLKTSRLSGYNLPLILTEPVNNCMNFALENYSGHGFWRDVATELAYPTNTAFYMEMLIEYLQA